MRLTTLSLAALAFAATAAADPAPAPSVLAYYPPAALAAGISGVASISCASTEHGGFTDCRLVSETPDGQGFGAAALAIAAHAYQCRDIHLTDVQRQPQTTRFQFTAAPLSITPDVLRPGWLIGDVAWSRQPDDIQVDRVYPQAAKEKLIQGGAVMQCAVVADGGLTACRILNEKPLGYGFADALLQLAPIYRVKAPCGADIAGLTVHVRQLFLLTTRPFPRLPGSIGMHR
jgi:hypothetical protein